jgi:ADP-ribose pyrophosphatase YjhB (NUDIX family)
MGAPSQLFDLPGSLARPRPICKDRGTPALVAPAVHAAVDSRSLPVKDFKLMETPHNLKPMAAVAVAAFRDGEVLLVKRAKPPYEGAWSLPGGSIGLGETAVAAASREFREETGLVASSLTLGHVSDMILREGGRGIAAHFIIVIYATRDPSGMLRAGGDAAEARWFETNVRLKLEVTPGLEAAIAGARAALDRFGSLTCGKA